MSLEPQDDGPDARSPRASYEVGHGKPPVEHRFKKGQSGNPLGRPRKPKARKKQDSPGFGAQPANKYLMEEAYRPVLVREGDKTVELPAIQAVFRAMGVAAMKGNRFAQRTLAELVQSVEAEDRKLRLDHLEAMIEYKCDWEKAIERARELGQADPHPIPHPDDIIIDFVNGTATVCGPMTKEDKAAWDKMFEYLDELQSDVTYWESAYRKARSADKKARFGELWKLHQKLFDKVNDNLPKRYRRNLSNRCWEKGASRPGEQSKERWPGER